jgi:hypothetical protein
VSGTPPCSSRARPPNSSTSLSRRRALGLPLASASLPAAATAAAACSGSGSEAGVTRLPYWSWSKVDPVVDLWNRAHPHIQAEASSPAGGENLFRPLTGHHVWPATLGLFGWLQDSLTTPEVITLAITGSLASTLALVVVVFAMQRYWRAGLSVGSLKG